MAITGTFRALTRMFEYWEAREWRVTSVEGDGGTLVSDGQTAVDVELRTSLKTVLEDLSEGQATLRSVSLDEGALTFDLTGRRSLIPPKSPQDGLVLDEIREWYLDGGELVVEMSIAASNSDERPVSTIDTEPLAATEGQSVVTDHTFIEGDAPDEKRGKPIESTEDNGQIFAEEITGGDEADAERRDGDDGDGRTVDDAGGRDAHEDGGGRDAHEDGVDPRVTSKIERQRPEVPPFADTAYLQAVYDAYDTFAEMADELDMDVTTETVRRYMIDAGVHEPTRYNTAAKSDGSAPSDAESVDSASPGPDTTAPPETAAAESGNEPRGETIEQEGPTPQHPGPADDNPQTLIADGIGLPDDLSVDEFIEIVKRSRTVYEVKRQMNVDWEAARDILNEYNLLDLVMGQLAMESDLYVSREEIVERIRESVTA